MIISHDFVDNKHALVIDIENKKSPWDNEIRLESFRMSIVIEIDNPY